MSDEEREHVETAIEDDAIDLDTDQEGDLDTAMREALEAIEQGPGQRLPEGGAGDDEATIPEGPEALQRELEAERERALRALADLENFRKRIQRERQEEHRFRAFEPLRDLLSVVDNLERALASQGSVEDLKQGVELILRQMERMLRAHGVERIEALGEAFDPGLHEAVGSADSADVTTPTVAEEMQPGYTMHGRLLRPAAVKVAMPAKPSDDATEEVD